MDALVHQLQGKTEGVTTTPQHELQALLSTAAAERLAILQRHEAGARVVGHYDFNNTYQYIISREETHLQWLQAALAESGVAQLPGAAAAIPVPAAPRQGKKVAPGAYRGILDDDARTLSAFVQRWRPRVDGMTHARHQSMMRVVLGESLEHARLFEQAGAGFEDVLGRRTERAGRVGAVLPDRWQE
jgi:hypothetical protein